jgi:hypothetical protein
MTIHYGTPRRAHRFFAAPASGGGPAFTADFLAGSVPSGISYSQSTPYTYFDSNGLLAISTGNRFDYDPVTLAAKGLLIEPQTTNLVLQSNPVTANWTASTSTTLTGSAGYGLDNTLSASQITCTTSGVTTGINIKASAAITTVSTTTYTFSAYLAYGASRYVYVELFASARQFTAVVVDLQTGTITQTQTTGLTFNTVTSGVDAANNATVTTSLGTGYGYYRVWITFKGPASVTPSIGFVAAATGNTFVATTGLPTYTSTGTESVNVYGVQLEASAYPTSLIPTTTTSASRGAVSVTNSGFSWYNASAGTAICVFDSDLLTPTGTVFALNTATTTGIATTAASTSVLCYFDSYGALLGSISRNTQNKIAMAYDGSNNAMCLNGGTIATPSTQATIVTPTKLVFGTDQSTVAFAGHIKSFTYYASRLTNAQLQTLTT